MAHLRKRSPDGSEPRPRDPVCGKELRPKEQSYLAIYRERRFRFCGWECLDRFQREPGRFASPSE